EAKTQLRLRAPTDVIDERSARSGAGRIEKNEIGRWDLVMLHRGLHQLHIRRHVSLRVLIRSARAFHRDHPSEHGGERNGEKADTAVEVDSSILFPNPRG